MDADLQHPPECIPRILAAAEEGCDVITMVRTRNRSAGFIKELASAGFYRLINALSDVQFEANASDFFCGEPPGGGSAEGQLPGKGPLSQGLRPEPGI